MHDSVPSIAESLPPASEDSDQPLVIDRVLPGGYCYDKDGKLLGRANPLDPTIAAAIQAGSALIKNGDISTGDGFNSTIGPFATSMPLVNDLGDVVGYSLRWAPCGRNATFTGLSFAGKRALFAKVSALILPTLEAWADLQEPELSRTCQMLAYRLLLHTDLTAVLDPAPLHGQSLLNFLDFARTQLWSDKEVSRETESRPAELEPSICIVAGTGAGPAAGQR